MKKYKNIIFDLGAVLVNWNPKEMIPKLFKDNNESTMQQIFQELKQSVWQDFDKGLVTIDEIISQYESKYDKENMLLLFDGIADFLSPIKSGIKILDKIKEKKYNIYILSNFSKDLFELASKKHDYENLILNKTNGGVISYQVQTIKPEPEIYQILLNNFNLDPNECLFVDDKEENIIAARNMGIDGIVCKNHEYLKDELKKIELI